MTESREPPEELGASVCAAFSREFAIREAEFPMFAAFRFPVVALPAAPVAGRTAPDAWLETFPVAGAMPVPDPGELVDDAVGVRS